MGCTRRGRPSYLSGSTERLVVSGMSKRAALLTPGKPLGISGTWIRSRSWRISARLTRRWRVLFQPIERGQGLPLGASQRGQLGGRGGVEAITIGPPRGQLLVLEAHAINARELDHEHRGGEQHNSQQFQSQGGLETPPVPIRS